MELFQSAGVRSVFRHEYDDIVAYYGTGYLGQTLMVVPEHRVVAVRQVKNSRDYDAQTDGLMDFKELVLRLICKPSPNQ